MRVRKTTPEEEQNDKEEAFLKLTGEERLRMMRIIGERFRNQELIMSCGIKQSG